MSFQLFWFIVIAVLFTAYFVLEGFDFGVGALSPIVAKMAGEDSEKARRVALNTIGPFWDANEVWLITAGGAMFAAFPGWYSSIFSGFYLALFLILLALILRNLSIEFRGKIASPKWKKACDYGFTIGSVMAAVLWGVAFANIIRGVTFRGTEVVNPSLLALLNPYSLLGGVAMLLLFCLHGALFVNLKTFGKVRDISRKLIFYLFTPTAVALVIFGLWSQISYGKDWTWIPLGLIVVFTIFSLLFSLQSKDLLAFISLCLVIAGLVILFFGILYPYVLPDINRIDGLGLTVYNASSSDYTLKIMTWAALIATPVIIGYQAWSFWVFRKRISIQSIPAGNGLPTN